MAGVVSLDKTRHSVPKDVRRDVLSRLQVYLVTNIIFDSLHDHLVSRQVFDDVTLSDIKEEPKTSGKIRMLLEMLKKGEHDAYNILKEALQNTRQGHIVKRLVETEKTVSAEMKRSGQQLPSYYSRSEIASQPQTMVVHPTPSIQGSPRMHDIHEKHVQDP